MPELENRFITRLVEFLQEEFEDARETPEPEVRQFARRQQSAAERYGLHTEEEVCHYVCLAWEMGPDFDTDYQSAREILADKNRDATEKVGALLSWADDLYEIDPNVL